VDLIAIGIIRTAWGLKGWLKLSSYSGEWDHFFSLKSVLLAAKAINRPKEYEVEGFRIHQGAGQLKFVGIDSPELAKTLSGAEIMVPREQGAGLAADEWYIADLIGLRMIDADANYLGKIVSVISSSDDILEVLTPGGSRFMVPFRTEFVGEPDMENGTLVLNALWIME